MSELTFPLAPAQAARLLATALLRVYGDVEGHPFHGNQWTGATSPSSDPIQRLKRKYGTTDDLNRTAFLLPDGTRIPFPTSSFQGHAQMAGGAVRADSTYDQDPLHRILHEGAVRVFPSVGVQLSQVPTNQQAEAIVKDFRATPEDKGTYDSFSVDVTSHGATVQSRDFPADERTTPTVIQSWVAHVLKNPKTLGGAGSGNFGHVGRPGEVGGSTTTGGFSQMVARLHQPDAGFTYQPITGQEPKTGYAVSVFRGRETALDEKDATFDSLWSYVRRNWDVLQQPDNYFGGWHDPQTHKIYLDISHVVKTAEEAERLGREHDQLSYFDLAQGQSIPVIGSQRRAAQEAYLRAHRSPYWRADTRRHRRAVLEVDGENADSEGDAESARRLSATARTAGGIGSGNFGHAGRPGEVGGSSPGAFGIGHGTSFGTAFTTAPIKLFHTSNDELAGGKPSFAAFFGDQSFLNDFPHEFGSHTYSVTLPRGTKLLDLNKDSRETREFQAEMARIAYPKDEQFPKELLQGKEGAKHDFYEIWTDKNFIIQAMSKYPGLDAVKYQNEYLLPQKTLAKLNGLKIAGDVEGHEFHGNQYTSVPLEPGTAPIPAGTVRRFHVTPLSNVDRIRAEGLTMQSARGIEGPRAIYSFPDYESAKRYDPLGQGAIVEHHAPAGSFDSNPYATQRSVPPEHIVAIHEPWHDHYRYAVKEGLTPDQLRGIGPEYDKAADALARHLKTLGDVEGHEFHGNQYTGGFGHFVEQFTMEHVGPLLGIGPYAPKETVSWTGRPHAVPMFTGTSEEALHHLLQSGLDPHMRVPVFQTREDAEQFIEKFGAQMHEWAGAAMLELDVPEDQFVAHDLRLTKGIDKTWITHAWHADADEIIGLGPWQEVSPKTLEAGSVRRYAVILVRRATPRTLGGPGSGNFGHAGRPGEVGGSAPGGGGDGSSAVQMQRYVVPATTEHRFFVPGTLPLSDQPLELKPRMDDVAHDLGVPIISPTELPDSVIASAQVDPVAPELPPEVAEGVHAAFKSIEATYPDLYPTIRNRVTLCVANHEPPNAFMTTALDARPGHEAAYLLINGTKATQDMMTRALKEPNWSVATQHMDGHASPSEQVRQLMTGVTIHELGHVLDAGGNASNAIAMALGTKFSFDMTRVEDWAIKHVSHYAAASPHEMFAEVFARHAYGDPIPKEFNMVKEALDLK